MVVFHTDVTVYHKVNLHFPMGFLSFSHFLMGFPLTSSCCHGLSEGNPNQPTSPATSLRLCGFCGFRKAKAEPRDARQEMIPATNVLDVAGETRRESRNTTKQWDVMGYKIL